ncbi:MAG: zinc-ribbon domain-containing protein [Sedimentisphaerales bacterium]
MKHMATIAKNNFMAANPHLAKEWHPTKNENLTPKDVTSGSNKKVWWKCSKGHEWQAVVSNRSRGSGCPFCVGKAVCDDNCLHTINSELTKEWHPTKNGSLTPRDVTANSHREVWWQCSKGHEWQDTVNHRSNGNICPYCSKRKRRIVHKKDCLQTINLPLSQEWHPTKNGNLTPMDVKAKSGKRVWWQCGEGHEWQAVVGDRSSGKGCPYCSSLQMLNPALAKEWHPTKNENLTPKDVTVSSNKKVWWQCSRGHEWQAVVGDRSSGKGCPYCSGRAVCDDNSLQTLNPTLAKEWHHKKNGSLTSKDVTTGSGRKVWWQCSRGHEWKTSVNNRSNGTGCPYCKSQTSQLELRILCEMRYIFGKVVHRKKILGKECDIYIPALRLGIEIDGWYWHQDRFEEDKSKGNFLRDKGINFMRIRENGLERVSSSDIFFSKKEKCFAVASRLVRKIMKEFALHEPSIIAAESYLRRQNYANDKEYKQLWATLPSPMSGYSLFDINPVLAREWHPTKNGKLIARDITVHSNKKVWWQCSKGHEWEAKVNNRSNGRGCPYCSGKAVCDDNSLQLLNPALTKEWHPTKNGSLTPKDVTTGSNKKVWWQCSKGHEWQAALSHRSNGTGCPYCIGKAVCDENSLQTVNPSLAKEWHSTKNGNLTPMDVRAKSGKRVWWQCSRGHEWQAIVANRSKGTGCPICARTGTVREEIP